MNSTNAGSLETIHTKIAQQGCAQGHPKMLRPSCAGATPGER
jgi:hypothetical protein